MTIAEGRALRVGDTILDRSDNDDVGTVTSNDTERIGVSWKNGKATSIKHDHFAYSRMEVEKSSDRGTLLLEGFGWKITHDKLTRNQLLWILSKVEEMK